MNAKLRLLTMPRLSILALVFGLTSLVFGCSDSQNRIDSEDTAFVSLGTVESKYIQRHAFPDNENDELLFVSVDEANSLRGYSRDLNTCFRQKIPTDLKVDEIFFVSDDHEIVLKGDFGALSFDIKTQEYSTPEKQNITDPKAFWPSPFDNKSFLEYRNFGTDVEAWYKLVARFPVGRTDERVVLDIRKLEKEHNGYFFLLASEQAKVWYAVGKKFFLLDLESEKSLLLHELDQKIETVEWLSDRTFFVNCREELLKLKLKDDGIIAKVLTRIRPIERFLWVDEESAIGFRNGSVGFPSEIVSVTFGEGACFDRKIIAKCSNAMLWMRRNERRDTFLFWDRSGKITVVQKVK